MLALVATLVGALDHSLEPSQQLRRRVCISTAVETKSVQCNQDCNADAAQCPRACVCSEPTETSVDLSLEMPSPEKYTALVDRLSKEVHEPAVTSLDRRKLPTTMAAAKVPSEALGYCELGHSPAHQPGAHALTQIRARDTDLRTWLCKDHQNKTDWECAGPSGKNINVIFSGHAVIDKALDAARMKSKGVECLPKSKKYCDKMADFMVSTTHEAKSREEAEKMMIVPGAKDEANCGKCFAPTPKAIDSPQPFSKKAGLYEGVPFLALGGASGNGVFTAERLKESFGGDEGLAAVKEFGFQGLCFDVEMTREDDPAALVAAFELAFAATRKAGLLVMVTTSHSAPYAAGSTETKLALVDSWAKSKTIDIFSPQLYTSGLEAEPELTLTGCGTVKSGRACTYERYAGLKAKLVPSLASGSHYAAAKEYFASIGIATQGYIQWGDSDKLV